MLFQMGMHRNPKREAQIVEDLGLTAEPDTTPSVTNPAAPGEEGIETAAAKERELELKQKSAPEKDRPREPAPSLDRLDRERAAGEGMTPPTNP